MFGRGSSVGPVNLTLADFERLVSQGGRLLVDFWAGWCPASQQFMPIFERASQRHPDVVFGKVDTEVEKELSAAMEVTSIPTVMAFHNQSLLYTQAGVHSPDDLDKLVSALRRVR